MISYSGPDTSWKILRKIGELPVLTITRSEGHVGVMLAVVERGDRLAQLRQALGMDAAYEVRVVELLHHPIEDDLWHRQLGHADRELEDVGTLLDQLISEFVQDEHLKLEIAGHQISDRAWHAAPPGTNNGSRASAGPIPHAKTGVDFVSKRAVALAVGSAQRLGWRWSRSAWPDDTPTGPQNGSRLNSRRRTKAETAR